jgi:hypothetical protein
MQVFDLHSAVASAFGDFRPSHRRKVPEMAHDLSMEACAGYATVLREIAACGDIPWFNARRERIEGALKGLRREIEWQAIIGAVDAIAANAFREAAPTGALAVG